MHPRVELHVHLDGSIPPENLLRVAQRRRLVLPGLGGRIPADVDDIWTALRSMGEHWKWFDLVNEIIGGEEETLAEIAEAFVDRQAAQGVSYTEVRWDPVRPATSHLANTSISVDAAVSAVARGLRSGSERHGIEVHQLLCAMRGKPGMACFELARLAARTRSGELGGVVGMDIAGDEVHFNNSVNHYEECFQYAKSELLLNTTVHAGESYTDQHQSFADVRSAIEVMLTDRVGHGYATVEDEATIELVMQRGIHLEACPAGGHGAHPVNLPATRIYKQRGISFGINTDDPATYFSNVSLGQVETLVRARLGFVDEDISDAYRNAYRASFAHDARRIAEAQRGMQQDTHGMNGGLVLLILIGALITAAFIGRLLLTIARQMKPAKLPTEVILVMRGNAV